MSPPLRYDISLLTLPEKLGSSRRIRTDASTGRRRKTRPSHIRTVESPSRRGCTRGSRIRAVGKRGTRRRNQFYVVRVKCIRARVYTRGPVRNKCDDQRCDDTSGRRPVNAKTAGRLGAELCRRARQQVVRVGGDGVLGLCMSLATIRKKISRPCIVIVSNTVGY